MCPGLTTPDTSDASTSGATSTVTSIRDDASAAGGSARSCATQLSAAAKIWPTVAATVGSKSRLRPQFVKYTASVRSSSGIAKSFVGSDPALCSIVGSARPTPHSAAFHTIGDLPCRSAERPEHALPPVAVTDTAARLSSVTNGVRFVGGQSPKSAQPSAVGIECAGSEETKSRRTSAADVREARSASARNCAGAVRRGRPENIERRSIALTHKFFSLCAFPADGGRARPTRSARPHRARADTGIDVT